MRDLTPNELNNVSGSGLLFAYIGKQIGYAIGSVVDDMSTAINGHPPKQASADAAALLGKGIGDILDLDVTGAINNMGLGISGIVAAAKANKKPAS